MGHLVSHAYFKAILFICAGIIIPNIRLCGIPFTRGFYSKDLILEVIFIGSQGLFIFIILLLGTALTLAYSVRIILLVGLRPVNAENMHFIVDNDPFIHSGIIVLIPFALIGGIPLS